MLEGILAISGQPGLYKHVSQTKTGIIVESIETKKRMPVYATAKVSALEDIAIFTTGEEVPLIEVFEKIYAIENKGKTSVDKKSESNELKDYFEDVLPDYDKERVYVSDIKKVIAWYNLLHESDLLDFSKKAEDTKEIEEVSEETNNKE